MAGVAGVRARRPPTSDQNNPENVLLDEEEQEKTIAELMQRNERDARIARIVVATTERVLAKKLTDADRAGYNESAARELAGV